LVKQLLKILGLVLVALMVWEAIGYSLAASHHGCLDDSMWINYSSGSVISFEYGYAVITDTGRLEYKCGEDGNFTIGKDGLSKVGHLSGGVLTFDGVNYQKFKNTAK
jgi:hypothetical protein